MWIATENAVYAIDGKGGRGAPRLLLRNSGVRALAGSGGIAAVALEGGDLVLLSASGDRRVAPSIPEPVESLLVLEEAPLCLLFGVEGPYLYRFSDDGAGAERLSAFDSLECRRDWHTPWGGPASVRTLAATRDGTVYADIHVGSIMRSQDRGDSWEPVTPGLHEDVHQVAVSPQEEERVYANTADAVFVSEDRGKSWSHRADGLEARYGRAIAVDPLDPDRLLATVSTGPHGNAQGRLYRTDDAGRKWTHVTDGFPASTKDNIDTHQVAFSADGLAWAAVGRTLYSSRDGARRWEICCDLPEPVLVIC